MKNVNYRKSAQKGLSPIIIIIVLAVIGLGAFVFYNNSKKSQNSFPSSSPTTNSNQTQTSSQTVPGLEKVEGSNYVFYYPQGYMKLDKQRISYYGQPVLYYALPSKKDTDEGISLTTESLSARNETPSSEYCNERTQFLAARLNKMLGKKPRVAEAKPVDFVKSHGCDSSLVFDSGNTHLVFNYKDLWFKEGSDFSVYSVIASYFISAPQTEIDILRLAVQNFMLK